MPTVSTDTSDDIESQGAETKQTQSLAAIRRRTAESVEAAMRSDRPTLVHSPPASGKTTSTFKRAVKLGQPVTYLTERTDLYEQAEGLAFDNDLQPYVLPSPHSDCPTFRGDNGKERAEYVKGLYDRVPNAKLIHSELDLPCGDECEYLDRLDFKPNRWDVLIGHYRHGYAGKYTENRIVVVDEFAGSSFVTRFADPEPIITAFAQEYDSFPADGYTDLVDSRNEARVIQWFAEHPELLENGMQVFDDETGLLNTTAGILALAPFVTRDLGNDWHTSEPEYHDYRLPNGESMGIPAKRCPGRKVWPDGYTVVRNRNRDNGINDIWLLQRPDFSDAFSVVGLDGTPVRSMWDTVFGLNWEVDRIVSPDRLGSYLRDTLNTTVHRTTDYVKPYHSGNYLTPSKDEALLLGIDVRHDEKPGLITTNTARRRYQAKGVLDRASDVLNYGNILSNNDFDEKQLGAILGSPHPGDDVLKQWGALDGVSITDNDERGVNRDYGPIGNDILGHFRENQVLQAILRFGRNDDESHVYVHTSALPEWIDAEKEGIGYFINERRRRIADYLREVDSPVTRGKIIEELNIPETTVYRNIAYLNEAGFVQSIDRGGNDPAVCRWVT